jgi:uncharacterized delta-60 repeat protein
MLKHLLLLSLSLLAAPLLCQPAAAQALDPTFAPPTSLYKPGGVYSMAAQQADGKRVVAGYFSRVNNTAVGTLARLDANGALDATFAQNVGVARDAFRVRALPNGQYMVSGYYGGAVTAGGLTRQALLRLNANGTADATFDAGTGAVNTTSGILLNTFVGQPDGKLVVGGSFTGFSGQNTGSLVRLTSTGAPDAAFNANLGTGLDGTVRTVAVQADGKLVVGGNFATLNGRAAQSLVRLHADGTRDASFTAALSPAADVGEVLVQPDGKLLVTGSLGSSAGLVSLVRLTATGSLDTGFTPPVYQSSFVGIYYDTIMQLQPDGKLLLFGPFAATGEATVVRLNANGTTDNTFTMSKGLSSLPFSIGLQRDGSLWVGGYFDVFNGQEEALSRLTSTGAADATFTPKIQAAGSVAAVVRQADGQLILGGDFTELNGVAVHRMARLSATGTLDVAFSTATAAVPDGQVAALALQPDGKLLVGARNGMRRLLPTGSPDASYGTFAATANISALALQPDGKVLALGYFNSVPGSNDPQYLTRLTAGGDFDASFRLSATNAPGATIFLTALALQPDGKVLVGGSFMPATGNAVSRVVRYESTGTVDASFSSPPFDFPASFGGRLAEFNALALQPDGKVLVGGNFATVGGAAHPYLARLNATGQLDATFTPPATLAGAVTALALQPNGRVLVGNGYEGSSSTIPLLRLLDTGASDPSFGPTTSPNYAINVLLAQSNDTFIVGGNFTTLGGQPALGLARITAPNVLAATAPITHSAHLAAWPVPAHEVLHVAVQAGAQAIELLDGLGRVVQQQGPAGAGELTLPVAGLPAGLYVLRVRYASGSLTRQLAVE